LVSDQPAKGREAVEAALIDAACNLLAEVGPRATSVRDIANRAGVNHGQVHHYFGGKRPLLEEAMRQMAQLHRRAMRELSGDQVIPPPLAVLEDQRYLRALVRATIEGDVDLARIEIDEGISVGRAILDFLTERRGLDDPPLDIKVALAEGMAMQLGWIALEPFLFLVADVKPEEQEQVRDRIRDIAYARRIPRP
jgi:AcrR family transcriptional regulator